MNRTMIASNQDIEVLFKEGAGDTVLVTFSSLGMLADGQSMAAEPVATKLGLPLLAIMCRTGNWFPANAMNDVLPQVRRVLDRFEARLGYGFSMGGFGAIKYSKLLNLTHTIAMSPQWSIDPDVAAWERRYLSHLIPWHRDMHITGDDCAGFLALIFDDLDPDKRHADEILSVHPNAHPIVARYIGHETFRLFTSSVAMGELFTAVLRQDDKSLREIVRRRRKQLPAFPSALLLQRALAAFRARRLRDAENSIRHALSFEDRLPAIAWLLSRILIATGRAAEAEAVNRAELVRYPNFDWLLLHLVEALEVQGKFEEALKAIAQLLQSNPRNEPALEARERISARLLPQA